MEAPDTIGAAASARPSTGPADVSAASKATAGLQSAATVSPDAAAGSAPATPSDATGPASASTAPAATADATTAAQTSPQAPAPDLSATIQAPPQPSVASRTASAAASSGADRSRGLAKSSAISGGAGNLKPLASPTSTAEIAKPDVAHTSAAPVVAAQTAAADQAEPEAIAAASTDPSAPAATPVAGAPLQETASTAVAPAATELRGSPDTVASFAAELVRRLDQQTSRFQVALNPGGLGRVDVSLTIGSDGALSADIGCDTPAGAAALKARSGELTTALGQAGFTLSPGALRIDAQPFAGGATTSGNAFADAQANGGGAGQGRPQAPAAWRTADADLDLSADLPAYAPSSRTRGLDIRI